MIFLSNDSAFSLRSFLLCLLIFSGARSYAQPLTLEFESYDTKKGLSQNQVFAIVQDTKGFLWFGTDEGLNRFDGHEFKVFRHDDNDSNSIADNSVHGLVVDDEGVLWIGTSTGLSRYYPEKESIQRLAISYDDRSKPKGTGVNEIKKAPDGSIWIAYLGSGADVYDPRTKQFEHYTTHRNDRYKIINDYVISVQFMPDGDKLLGTRAGVQFIGKDGIPLTPEESDQKYPWRSQIDNSITAFHLTADGSALWIGSELAGAYRVDLRTNVVSNFNTMNSALKFNNNVPSVFEDSRGNVWIGGEAIYLFDRERNALVAYDEHGIRGNVVNKNPVMSIFEDRDNNLWFGTFRLGVLKYNPDNTKILHFHSGHGEGSITNDHILSFAEDRSRRLWVGTDGGGLFRFQEREDRFEPAPGSEKFASQVIKCIYQAPGGEFWIGTWDGGMIRYDPATRKTQNFNPSVGNFPSRHVWDIKGDDDGNLWVGTLRDGLCYFSPRTGKYEYFYSTPGDSTSLVNNDVMCLFRDSRKRLWIGTSNGLSILPADSREFINFTKSELAVTVLTIYEDPKGSIWLGTNGGGIIVMDRELNIIRTIGEKDGLPSSTVCTIEPDGKNNLWVSTYNGLARISLGDGSISEVPLIAGLQGKEFIPRSSYSSSDGRMMFGGVNGFNLFHPDSLTFNPIPKPIVFTSLRIN
ncbi:MAG TPA: two-component regulator propeller domain-containing protein, partial [Chryseosolibacter sp.]|nr:two-component regulator propeller domain-containing protein [Chryseosolibacter sp.]